MATAWIGAYNFIELRGSINGLQQRLEPFERAGVNGNGFIDVGQRAEVSNLQTTRDLPFLLSPKNRMNSYWNMVGSVVNITDNKGAIWNNMLVLQAAEVDAFAIESGSGGLEINPQAIQVVNWQVQQLWR